MEDIEKLRVIIPHWIEHNKEHGKEFEKWANQMQDSEAKEIGALLRQATGSLRTVEVFLQQALSKAGGPLEGHAHHPHHH